MAVEWKMGAVYGQVGFNAKPYLLISVSYDRYWGNPKKAMVHDKEIDVGFSRFLKGGKSSIDCSAYFGNRTVVCDLQAVVRAGEIGNVDTLGSLIAEFDEFGCRSHDNMK
jgi:hypothetical protein